MWRIKRVIRENTWDRIQSYLNPVLRHAQGSNVRNFVMQHPITFLLIRIRSLENENRELTRKVYDCKENTDEAGLPEE